MKAQLIGEKSAGQLAVHIIDDNDNIIWSHRWFDDGATEAGYRAGLRQAYEAMRDCSTVHEWSEDGNDAYDYDDADTTGVMLEYDPGSDTWTIGDRPDLGLGREIVDACINAGLVGADDHYREYGPATGTITIG